VEIKDPLHLQVQRVLKDQREIKDSKEVRVIHQKDQRVLKVHHQLGHKVMLELKVHKVV
jgi:hypothetical protein